MSKVVNERHNLEQGNNVEVLQTKTNAPIFIHA